jgi:hypothetical protein
VSALGRGFREIRDLHFFISGGPTVVLKGASGPRWRIRVALGAILGLPSLIFHAASFMSAIATLHPHIARFGNGPACRPP